MQIENFIIDITAVGNLVTEKEKDELREILKTSTTSSELRTKFKPFIEKVVRRVPMTSFIQFIGDYVEAKVEDELSNIFLEIRDEQLVNNG